MEVIAAAKQMNTHKMMLLGIVGKGRGQGAALRWTGPGHFTGRGLLQDGMLISCSGAAAWEGLVLDHLLQHNEVDNPL